MTGDAAGADERLGHLIERVRKLGSTAVVIDGGAEHAYPGFDELHASGVESVEGLKQAIDAIAAKIAQQI